MKVPSVAVFLFLWSGKAWVFDSMVVDADAMRLGFRRSSDAAHDLDGGMEPIPGSAVTTWCVRHGVGLWRWCPPGPIPHLDGFATEAVIKMPDWWLVVEGGFKMMQQTERLVTSLLEDA